MHSSRGLLPSSRWPARRCGSRSVSSAKPLQWQDRALRRQLTRLVELEYVLVYRTGRGNGRVYQLLYEPQSDQAPAWQLGLRDVTSLGSGWQNGRTLTPCSIAPRSSDSAVTPLEPAALRHPCGGPPAGCQNAVNCRLFHSLAFEPAVAAKTRKTPPFSGGR